jgi:SAM-dependent methyltransferase
MLNKKIEGFYDMNVLEEWERLDRHRTEFALTLRALGEFLPPAPVQILDVGGGPGRYSIELARRGYNVTLVDLSQNNLEFAKEKAQESGVEILDHVHGDVLALEKLPLGAYDAALLFGPLYHLLDESDRRKAVQQVLNVLKPNGRLFAAFITRFAPIRDAAKNYPDLAYQNPDYAWQLLETGVHDSGQGFTDAYFAHLHEIIPFMESLELRTLHLIGVEGIVAGVEEKVNELTGEDWGYWVEFNYHIGQDPAAHGCSDHLLYIGEVV